LAERKAAGPQLPDFAVSRQRQPAAALIGEDETGFRAVEQHDALGFAQRFGRDALVRIALQWLRTSR